MRIDNENRQKNDEQALQSIFIENIESKQGTKQLNGHSCHRLYKRPEVK
jgi:hypothetical protein